ncbi:MAG: LytTR family DNA-binding domain-containing protein [Gemmatimonadota bacterium]|nr:MAG: LytTR family DNA-binding domain-containing protein [Gemmatimonadota bacterium]
MTFSAIIVDDEAPARKRLRDLLKDEDDVEIVAECPDGPSAVDAILHYEPDVLFLDVQMPEMGGFEVLRAVGPDQAPTVVFVTAYERHAVEAFEARALDYLLKPFTRSRFRETLARVRARSSSARDGTGLRGRIEELLDTVRDGVRRIPVRTGSRIRFVEVSDVDWIEGAGNYVILHVGGRQHRVRGSLKGFAGKLDARRFIRIHHSYIVNLDRLRELQPWSHGEFVVILQDGTHLTSSRTYSDALREVLEL